MRETFVLLAGKRDFPCQAIDKALQVVACSQRAFQPLHLNHHRKVHVVLTGRRLWTWYWHFGPVSQSWVQPQSNVRLRSYAD